MKIPLSKGRSMLKRSEKGGKAMLKTIEVKQAEIEIKGSRYWITHIPTATSGMWYTIHDLFEVWAAVAIDLDGTVVGWRNPPVEPWRTEIVKAIRAAWGLPEPTSTEETAESE
jgi:hypothetical protein